MRHRCCASHVLSRGKAFPVLRKTQVSWFFLSNKDSVSRFCVFVWCSVLGVCLALEKLLLSFLNLLRKKGQRGSWIILKWVVFVQLCLFSSPKEALILIFYHDTLGLEENIYEAWPWCKYIRVSRQKVCVTITYIKNMSQFSVVEFYWCDLYFFFFAQ